MTVTTLAGSTAGDAEKLNEPSDVAVDQDGNVYVADRGHQKIKKITASGVVSTQAGSTEGDGDKFNTPTGVAVDGDANVYVADLSNHKIKKIRRNKNNSACNMTVRFRFDPNGLLTHN